MRRTASGLRALVCALLGTVSALADEITVVSWNLQWFPGRVPYARREARQEHLAAAQAKLRELNPDIFIAQEVTSERAFRDLVAAVPGLQVHVVSHFDRGTSPKAQQVGIASRLTSRSAWSASWDAAGAVQPPRGYAVAVLETASAETVLVYGVHLKSNRTDGPSLTLTDCIAQREEATRQLLAHLQVMSDVYRGGLPVACIVGGDLNTNGEQPELAGERTLAWLKEGGLVDAWRDTPPDQRITWVGSADFAPRTFDYLFTRGWESRAATVDTSAISDHHAVVGRLRPHPRAARAETALFGHAAAPTIAAHWENEP